ncbi:hypothetical protein ACTI_70250 [Actinoplanes sp. OR16]|uniref:nucleotidyltransferase domain-containing protein n=1 Tax=Actinoplanes sp. OR16 TaxID=946334 RepID=UPI000F701C41|nr:nucleotidyltransferase domain-containing protein [Actinoplanes sp. OR16]BBH70340.1 hypothetical protein ACTI_70250 [Actinoplanes sp. OR16]
MRDALAIADRLAEGIVSVLGADVRSVILHGSLATGDFRPGRSDIDLLVITDGGVTREQAFALRDLLSPEPVDLHVVTSAVAGKPSRSPAVEVYLGHGDFSDGIAADADLPTELSVARAHGRALYGPEPSTVIAPIPDHWIVERGRHWLRTWQSLTGDAEHAAFMVLTACRIWRFAAEGTHCSKPEAARWALARDPSLTAVGQALRPPATIDEAAIGAVLEAALAATSREAAADPPQ